MTKVYQTVIDKGNGNCMQAAVASLFDMKLEEVPNFIEYEEYKWYDVWVKFWDEKGYSIATYGVKGDLRGARKIAKRDGGVNGYFFASVNSLTYPGECTHAVIVDINLNVVHDPNPNGRALALKPKDILTIEVKKILLFDDIAG